MNDKWAKILEGWDLGLSKGVEQLHYGWTYDLTNSKPFDYKADEHSRPTLAMSLARINAYLWAEGSEFRARRSVDAAAQMKAMWADPEFRKKRLVAQEHGRHKRFPGLYIQKSNKRRKEK